MKNLLITSALIIFLAINTTVEGAEIPDTTLAKPTVILSSFSNTDNHYDLSKQFMIFYPNITADNLFMDCNFFKPTQINLKIYKGSGQKVSEILLPQVMQGTYKIDLSRFEKGEYTIKIFTGSGQATIKVSLVNKSELVNISK